MEEKEVAESKAKAEVSVQEQKRIQKEEAVKIAAYKKQLKEENEDLYELKYELVEDDKIQSKEDMPFFME